MSTIIIISFLAGVLTVLAPCVLPLLPVILGGGLAGTSRKRPYIIIASLVASLMLFTILLKASTLLITVEPKVWDYISGGLLILFGITLVFPFLWSWFVVKTGIEHWFQNSLQNASEKEGIWGPIGIGAALGPVFSSCNPTYSLLLATVLPLDIVSGLIGLTAYFIGLGFILLLVTLFGRNILGKFSFFANPSGLFRRILGIIIVVVGIFATFGTIKDLQTYVVENGNFSFLSQLEKGLNEKIDTQVLKEDIDGDMVCSGGNCMPKNPTESGVLIDIGDAPEITGITEWINSNPLTLASLRGKVILVDFWTYSCINCQRTQPYLNAWHEKYASEGLVILGLHAPEFAFEKLRKNVEKAVIGAGIKYPVALDNDFKTWNAYDNKYWPAKYLIDQKGNIVYKHFGEGEYAETEQKIQKLLGAKKELEKETEKVGRQKTPETYLGSARAKNMVFEQGNFIDGPQSFFTTELRRINEWTLSGPWKVTPEYIESLGEHTALILRFAAKSVHLVVSSQSQTGEIIVEALNPQNQVISSKTINVTRDDLYTLFNTSNFTPDQILRIRASDGLRLHAFTFG